MAVQRNVSEAAVTDWGWLFVPVADSSLFYLHAQFVGYLNFLTQTRGIHSAGCNNSNDTGLWAINSRLCVIPPRILFCGVRGRAMEFLSGIAKTADRHCE